tara:strand:+ start:623 stop:1024 length:402 start_codon:yes stop_codon:yes gene_type:complete
MEKFLFHGKDVPLENGNLCSIENPHDIEPIIWLACTANKLQILSFDECYWRGKYRSKKKRDIKCNCCGGKRYLEADIRFPCIAYEYDDQESTRNKYCVIDGCHRIEKLITHNINETLFFVLKEEEVPRHAPRS